MLSYIQYLFCFFTGENIKLSLGTEEVKVCLLEILVSCLLIWCLKDHSVLSLLWLLSGMFLKLLLYVDVNTPWSIVSFAMKYLCAQSLQEAFIRIEELLFVLLLFLWNYIHYFNFLPLMGEKIIFWSVTSKEFNWF